jgi:hypothetical protein
VTVVVVMGVPAGSAGIAGALESQWERLCAAQAFFRGMVMTGGQDPLELEDAARAQPKQGQESEPRTPAQHGS